jgi:hypothetical protein
LRIQVHVAAANRLPCDLAVVVIVRRQRETRGMQDGASLGSDEDPRLPTPRKLKREAESSDGAIRCVPRLSLGHYTSATHEPEHGQRQEQRSLHIGPTVGDMKQVPPNPSPADERVRMAAKARRAVTAL